MQPGGHRGVCAHLLVAPAPGCAQAHLRVCLGQVDPDAPVHDHVHLHRLPRSARLTWTRAPVGGTARVETKTLTRVLIRRQTRTPGGGPQRHAETRARSTKLNPTSPAGAHRHSRNATTERPFTRSSRDGQP